jgi:hypothetical protein
MEIIQYKNFKINLPYKLYSIEELEKILEDAKEIRKYQNKKLDECMKREKDD